MQPLPLQGYRIKYTNSSKKNTSMKQILIVVFSLIVGLVNASNSINKAKEKFTLNAFAFEENKGQVSGNDGSKVHFVHRGKGVSVFLLNNGLAYQYSQANEVEKKEPQEMSINLSTSTYRMDMILEGANMQSVIRGEGKSFDYVNYYNNNVLNVHGFERVVYQDIYPNIDWIIYMNEDGIKYDFVVKPNGNPNQIQFKGKWVEKMYLDKLGNLHLENRMGTIQEQCPVSFQNDKKIETEFVLKDELLSFKLAPYNTKETLVIDPQLIWGSYYGGESTDGINSVTTDSQGNVYFCGGTTSFNGIAEGGFLNTNPISAGFGAAFLVKFNAEGQRIWATYYGGLSFTTGLGCKIDSEDNVYMLGTTDCLSGIAQNGFQNNYGGGAGLFDGDAFLVKFNPIGERIWATYLGGTEGDSGQGMEIDDFDNIYIVGRARSTTGIALNGYQNNLNAGVFDDSDVFLAKFNTGGALLWSTYFGGEKSDDCWTVSCDNLGNVFIAGRTNSTDFPILNAHQASFGNPAQTSLNDAFVAKFSTLGALLWSTYCGGLDMDEAWGCSADDLGNVYICGRTLSANNIFFNGFNNATQGSFLAKFSSSGVRLWGTYFSEGDVGGNSEWAFDCKTDSENNVYMVGRTNDPTIGFQGFQNTFTSSGFTTDGYIVKFSPSGSRLWASYYGGLFFDGLRGCHVDPSDQLYVVGSTASDNNIFFQGFQSTQENECGYIAKIGCPTVQLTNLPSEICANSSLDLTPFPLGGSLQLLGQGTLTGTNYLAPDVTQNTDVNFQYTINASSSCPSSSNNFIVTVLPNLTPSVTITASDLIICENQQVDFTAIVLNAGSTPGIEWLVNNISVASNQNSYSSSNLLSNDIVQCVVTSNDVCASSNNVQSNSIAITVNPSVVPSISIAANPGNVVCSGTFVEFLPSPINGGSSAIYEWFINGVSQGLATNGFSSSSLVDGDVVSVTMTTNEQCVTQNSVNSNSIAMSIATSLTPSVLIESALGNTVCSGSTLSLNANAINGGPSPTYNWTINGNSIGSAASINTPQILGTTTVEVTLTSNDNCANGATANGSFVIDVYELPIINTSSTPNSCNGLSNGSVTATVTGGSPAVSFSWNTVPPSYTSTVNNLAGGSYAVIVTYGNGCVTAAIATVETSGITLTNSTVLAQTDEETPNGTISIGVTGGQAPYSYLWNTTPISTLNTIEGAEAGTYTCIVTDNTGCSETFSFEVPYSVGLDEVKKEAFELYPNPTTGDLFIKSKLISTENVTVEMFDISGKIVLSETNNIQGNSIYHYTISNLPRGAYFIQLSSKSQRINKKVIKL
jgi:hypothetical protein